MTLTDLIMLRPDPKVTPIEIGSAQPQFAQGSEVSDFRGTRTAAVIFPSNFTAQAVLPSGGLRALTGPVNFRITEYTVGEDGPSRMPANLPAATAYTYAAEFSLDEALALGADSVRLSKPVSFYLDNFMNVGVGAIVPMGTYDRSSAEWKADPNGLVLKIIGVANGLAQIDIGSGTVPSQEWLSALGFSDEELRLLATKYPVGKELWRIQVSHFSPKDANFQSARQRKGKGWNRPRGHNADNPEHPCESSNDWLIAGGPGDNMGDVPSSEVTTITGCEINPLTRVIRETIGLSGVSSDLHYSSQRQLGFQAGTTYKLPVLPAVVPPSLISVRVTTNVAGRSFVETLAPLANLEYHFKLWDGQDAYGRYLTSPTNANITVSYVYPLRQTICYFNSNGPLNAYFFVPGFAAGQIEEVRGSCIIYTRPNEFETVDVPFVITLGPTRASTGASVGSWTLSEHHALDPVGKTLYLGTGHSIVADLLGPKVVTIAGAGGAGTAGDDGPAYSAQLVGPRGLAQSPDGTLYIVDGCCTIRKVNRDGIITRFAGTGVAGYSGDGGTALQATFQSISRPSFKADGTLIFADGPNNVIRSIDTSGIVRTIAGLPGQVGEPVIGALASESKFSRPGAPMVSSDGSIFFADQGLHKIFRISTTGLVYHVAGNGTAGYSGDGGNAVDAQLNSPSFCAEDSDGSLFIADRDNHIVRQISPNGIISTYAGTPTQAGPAEENVDPAQAHFNRPNDLTLNRKGELFVVDNGNNLIRKITSEGRVIIAAGGGSANFIRRIVTGPEVRLNNPSNVTWDSLTDDIIFSDNNNNVVRRLQSLIQPDATGYRVGSLDGRQIFEFDSNGRHLRTRSALTQQVMRTFDYDNRGRLITMTDAYGAVTTIARNNGGLATEITGPDGHVNRVEVNGEDLLTAVVKPMGERTEISYLPGGLLYTFRKPEGQTSTYRYSDLGELSSEVTPGGGSKTFAPSGNSVKVTDSLGRERTFRRYVNENDGISFEDIDWAGLVTTRSSRKGVTHDVSYPDGSSTGRVESLDQLTGTSQYGSSFSFSGYPGQSYVSTQTRNLQTNANGFVQQVQRKGFTSIDSVTFDSSTRQYSYQTRMGRTSKSTVDLNENPTSTQVGNFTPVTYDYDSRGRLVQINQGPRRTALAYNSRGLLSSVTSPLNLTTNFAYDSSGRLVRTTRPDGHEISFALNANSNVTAIQTPSGYIHQMLYNIMDLLSSYQPPNLGGAGLLSFVYNSEKELTSESRSDGRTLSYTRDNATGRLIRAGDQNSFVNLEYDLAGRISKSTSSDGVSVERTFVGPRPISKTYSGILNASIARTYLTKDLVLSDSINGNSISYTYDLDERLKSAGDLVLTREPASGRITTISLNNVSIQKEYNSFGEIISSDAKFNGQTIFSEQFQRDALGRISSKVESISGESNNYAYIYDILGRLYQVEKNSVLASTYSYDLNGNRLAATVRGQNFTGVHDQQDRLLSYGSKIYTYTAHGDLSSARETISDITSTYSYDVFGQTKMVRVNPAMLVEYLTDANGHRVAKKINGQVVKNYIYGIDGRQEAEIDLAGVFSHFVYASQGHSPDYMIRAGTKYAFVKDVLGSIRMVINSTTGEVVQALDYSEFGEVIGDSRPDFQPFGFAGGIYDRDTNLVRFGARDYDPETGRWTAKDPIRFAGKSSNLYGYVSQDPINQIDPSGLIIDVGAGISIPSSVRNSDLWRNLDARKETINIRDVSYPRSQMGEIYFDSTSPVTIGIDRGNIDFNQYPLGEILIHELTHAQTVLDHRNDPSVNMSDLLNLDHRNLSRKYKGVNYCPN